MVRPLDEEENDRQFAQNAPEATGAGLIGGGSTAASSSSAPGPTNTTGKGSGFVNTSDYLEANKGKGAALGGLITADAQKAAGDYSTAYQGLKNLQLQGLPDDYDKRNSLEKLLIRPDKNDDPDRYKEFTDYLANGGGKKIEVGGYDPGSLQSQTDSVKALKGKVGSYADTFGDSPNSKEVRSQLLRDKANDAVKAGKLGSYNENQQAFDSVFLEAENPELLSNTSKSLKGLLGSLNDSEIDKLVKDKRDAYNNATSQAGKYNDEIGQLQGNYDDAVKTRQAEIDYNRDHPATVGNDESPDGRVTTENYGPGPSGQGTITRTANADGTTTVVDKQKDGSTTTVVYGPDGKIIKSDGFT